MTNSIDGDCFVHAAVHWAAARGQIAALKVILKFKSELVESRGQEGCTPLLIAACCGHGETINYLLRPEVGTDINAGTLHGRVNERDY